MTRVDLTPSYSVLIRQESDAGPNGGRFKRERLLLEGKPLQEALRFVREQAGALSEAWALTVVDERTGAVVHGPIPGRGVALTPKRPARAASWFDRPEYKSRG